MKTKHNTNTGRMKNVFLLLLLFTGMVEAQIVNIPDANFKAKLISLGIDSNSSGEIDTFETTLVSTLHLENSNINNLIGIEAFTNLNILYCDTNNLTFLDLSSNINLTFLSCRSNQIAFLNLSNNPNLTDVLADSNALNGINVSNNPNLTDLWVFNNNLTTLNVSNCSSLRVLSCGQNSLTTLDLSSNLALADLNCSENLLTNLNVSGLINLTRLYCTQNQLTSLDVSSLTSLQYLYCEFNQIPSINISGLFNLLHFYCNGNLLTSLDFTGLTVLEEVSCDENQLTTLDMSQQSSLVILRCRLNNLESLFIKNGTGNGTQLYFDGNPNIEFICADEDELVGVQLLLVAYGYNNCTVNTYCSFQPGGVYNTIEGQVLFDVDSNGCDAADLPQAYLRMDMTQWGINSATFTNATGNYRFFTTFADQMITPNFENSPYFIISPPEAIVSFAETNFLTFNQNFCIAPNGVHRDVEMVISPVTFARPGFNAIYRLVYRNKGNQTVTVYPNFSYNESLLDLISSSVTPNQINPGGLSWVIPNIHPFESGSIEITLRVNAPTDTPAVNIGDVLTFTSFVDIENIDENWEDNAYTLNQTVVGSYDPNNIICLEGDVVPATEIGNYLHYAINFENTGTFPAENVVVKTEVDATKFNIDSLQLMNSNFPVDARITGNKVEFIYENIQLPIGGHGHILLKIKTQNTLVTGDAVANRGDIFFDYNFPIDTGLANTVFQTLSNSVFEIDSSVAVYPNPAVNEVTITADSKIKSIQLYDAQGRIILTRLMDDLESKLDISSRSKGIYFIKIITEKGAIVEKLMKE